MMLNMCFKLLHLQVPVESSNSENLLSRKEGLFLVFLCLLLLSSSLLSTTLEQLLSLTHFQGSSFRAETVAAVAAFFSGIFLSKMEDINEDQVVCLDVGGDRHFIKRGFLVR